MTDTFEFRRQARGPGNYLALGVTMATLYLGWSQGWSLLAMFLCGPFLALVLVRLVLNEAEGFRLTQDGVEYYSHDSDRMIAWRSLSSVTVTGDGAGGAECVLHLRDASTDVLPATTGFSPERLGQEFRARGVIVRRAKTQAQMASRGQWQ